MDTPDGGTSASPDAGVAGPDGGDAGPGTMPLPRSGSRLSVHADTVLGEVVRLTQTVDETHGVPCGPSLASDGVTRCLPLLAYDSYLDAECTLPVVRQAGENLCRGQKGEYALWASDQAVCPVTYRTFRVLDEIPAPPTVYGKLGAACLGSPPGSADHFFAVEETPPGDWVKLDRKVIRATRELGVVMWEGEDGAELQGGLTVLPDDVPCTPTELSGRQRCVPQLGAESAADVHADAACTDALWRRRRCDDERLNVPITPDGACPGTKVIHAFSALPLDTTFRWMNPSSNACEALSAALTDPTYALGLLSEALPPESFPLLEPHPSRTPGAAPVLTNHGVPLTWGEGNCGWAWFDGVQYCLSTSTGGAFSDPACTEVVAVASEYSCNPFVAPEWLVDGDAGILCRPGLAYKSIRRVLEPYVGPVFDQLGGECVPHVSTRVEHYYHVGPELPAADALALMSDTKL